MRSRITLATIEAAAIDCERWSPLTSARPAQGRPGGTSRPSASASFGRQRQADQRAAHRLEAGLAGCCCGRCPRRRPRPSRRRAPCRGCSRNSASRCAWRQALGIVEAVGDVGGVEDDGAATTGPASGPRPASSMPATGHRPSRHRLRLEGEVGSFDDLEEGRRIGTRASHGAARLASAPILRKSFRVEWGGGPGRHRRQAGAGRTGFLATALAQAAAANCIQSSISCSFGFSGGDERSVRSVRRSTLRPSRLAAISKRRPICQA